MLKARISASKHCSGLLQIRHRLSLRRGTENGGIGMGNRERGTGNFFNTRNL